MNQANVLHTGLDAATAEAMTREWTSRYWKVLNCGYIQDQGYWIMFEAVDG